LTTAAAAPAALPQVDHHRRGMLGHHDTPNTSNSTKALHPSASAPA
jgi:hypothetical protein